MRDQSLSTSPGDGMLSSHTLLLWYPLADHETFTRTGLRQVPWLVHAKPEGNQLFSIESAASGISLKTSKTDKEAVTLLLSSAGS